LSCSLMCSQFLFLIKHSIPNKGDAKVQLFF
jgi:hypothetical protein